MADIPKPKYNELHRVAITAIIYNEYQKYLITKRSPEKKVFPNRWTVPGGGLEVDDYIDDKRASDKEGQWYEVIEKALRREVFEEVNIDIESPEYLTDLVFIRPDGIPVLVLSYFVKHKKGKVKLDEDAVDYKWISAQEVEDYNLISGIEDEIKEVDEILEKRN